MWILSKIFLLSIFCLLDKTLLAQVASVIPPSPQTGTSSDESSTAPQFQLSVSYGFPKFSLDVGGSRALAKAADLGAYEDQQPVSGTFKGGSAVASRTVASILFGHKENSFTFGIGLESLELGLKEKLTKGPSQASFEMNSLVLEGGVQRNSGRWIQSSLKLSLSQGLSGRLRTRYLGYSSYAATPATYISIDDNVTTATRMGISGQYLFNLSSALSLGLQSSAEYGTVQFEARKTKSVVYGYHWGLALLMRI